MQFDFDLDKLLAVSKLCITQPTVIPKLASLRRAVLSEPTAPDAVLVGTHHKCLTVFLGQMFKSFSMLTGKSISVGRGASIDYSRHILFDHHSEFDFERLKLSFAGIHVRRDPRDVLVSSAFYHRTSKERWLHRADPSLQGKTYQEFVNSLPSFEQILLFELDHASGNAIETMVRWNYHDARFCEFSYEELISEDASRVFLGKISNRFPQSYTNLIGALFEMFAHNGALAKRRHIRNPSSGQWRKHFTPRVSDAFNERFGEDLVRLGYDRA